MPDTSSFEARLERLEAIVAELESEGVPLARALELFQEGVECLRSATAELGRVEEQVQRLVEREDGSFDLDDLRS